MHEMEEQRPSLPYQQLRSDEIIDISTHRMFLGLIMGVFHWSRPVGNYVFFESRDQCLQGQLGSVVVSKTVGVSR